MNYLYVIFFWTCAFLIFFIYIGYPTMLFVISRFSPVPVKKNNITPSITIIIPAYNEEKFIGTTIENKLSLSYQKNKISICVVSDCSTDRTNEIVEKYHSHGIRLVILGKRQGKTAALNEAVKNTESDVIIFSDSNSMYHQDALNHLVSNFADPKVGYVTGHMQYMNPDGSLIGDGCSGYMKYENIVRTLETKCGSIVGVDGGIDAIRRDLYTEMPADALPDFVLPLKVIEKGYRVIYEPDAILYEDALASPKDEYRMRVRVSLRAFNALHMMKHLFNPFIYGLFSLQLLVHKLLRYLAGFFLLIVFLTNIVLLNTHPIYVVTLAFQLVFYILAGIGFLLKKNNISPLTYIPFYFLLLNFSSLVAFLHFCAGKKQTVWEPRKG